jgi:hypothetical protein
MSNNAEMTAEKLIEDAQYALLGSQIENAIRRELMDWCPLVERVEGFESAVVGAYLGVIEVLKKHVEGTNE